MSQRRRPVRYYSSKRRKQKEGFAVKPLLFILVIAFSLAMRFASTGPLYRVREKITEVLSYSVDFGDAVETLGRAFSGTEDGEESAVLVFGRMILGIEEEVPPQTQPQSHVSLPQTSSIASTMAGDISGLTFDIAESPMPEMEFDAIDCGFSEEEEYDGTPNQAFEIPSPDIVDDGVYDLGFKTTMPLSGYRVTSYFGYRIHPISGNTTFHYGADLAASAGTKVVSISDGTVTETGYGSINGNYIKVSHKDGFVSHYTHLKSIDVSKGQKVSIGQQIGTVGSTGYSTGPHLHFEIRKDGKVLDPFDYFSF